MGPRRPARRNVPPHKLGYGRPPRRRDQPSAWWVVAIFGVLPLLLGLRWLSIFVLTDFRAHYRPVMIPLGLIVTLAGVAMMASPWIARRRRRY